MTSPPNPATGQRLDCRTVQQQPAMAVFTHHCYEYRRGLRKLIMHTAPAVHEGMIRAHLERAGFDYHVQRFAGARHINVFFGCEAHVAVLRSFGDRPVNEHTPEEDFILGTMLGYDGTAQCQRYLSRVDARVASGAGGCGCGGDCGCASGAACTCKAPIVAVGTGNHAQDEVTA